MRLPSQPFEPRRRRELRDELVGRARVWLPDWKPREAGTDLATAIFDIAARIETEVTERLNRMPEKTFRGFLYWLGVRGRAGQAARLPVVFQMSASGNAVVEPVDAPAGVQLQAAAETPISFETQEPLRILPGQIDLMMAADPGADGLFLPPAGLLALEAPKAEPSEWQLKAPVSPGASQLQLEPELGLVVDRILREPASGFEYRITAVEGSIVTIEPALQGSVLEAGRRLVKVSSFTPFSTAARNRQEHVLYIGAQDALNVEVPAVIEIVNGGSIPPDVEWSYSGKTAAGNAWIRIPEADVIRERGRVFLWKPAGPIEQAKVNEISGRWLKAVRPAGFDTPYQTSQLKLLINCRPKEWPEGWDDRKDSADIASPAKLEGIANTAPLVLDTPFYPLGREPRLFDAFYVGSKEAFSKPSARITLDFKLGDNFDSPLAALARSGDYLIVGVGGDHKLQRLHQTLIGAVGSKTAQIRFGGGTQPKNDGGQPVDLDGSLRPASVYFANISYVAVKAGQDAWLWQTSDDDQTQAWTSLGRPFEDGQTVIDLVLLANPFTGGLMLYALGAEGKVRRRDPLHTSIWSDAIPASLTTLRRLAPVFGIATTPGQQSETEGLVAITKTGEVYLRDATGTWRLIDADKPFDPAVYPLVIDSGTGRRWCFGKKLGADTILACDLNEAQPVTCATESAVLLGNAFDFARRGASNVVAVLLTGAASSSARPAVWDPFDEGTLVFADVPVERATLGHAPITIGGEAGVSRYHLFAGDDGSVTVVAFDPSLIESVADAELTDVMLFTDSANWSAQTNLFVVIGTGSLRRSRKVEDVISLGANRWAFKIDSGPPRRDPIGAVVYRAAPNTIRVGTRLDDLHLELANGDGNPGDGGALFVKGDRTSVVSISRVVDDNGTRTASVRHVLPIGDADDHVDYTNLEELDSFTVTVRPAVDVEALSAPLVARLADAIFEFEDVDPSRQTTLHVIGGEDLAILRSPWSATPPSSSDMTVMAAFSGWDRVEPPRPQNPKLSWEYFDGTAWWHLTLLGDGTDNLVKTGLVTFCVPANLKPTDVAGRPNHWIRARLVGGSYGQESVTLITSPLPESPTLPKGSTSQTVQRSTDDIHAPYVVSLTLGYEVCCAIAPDVVLAADNHGFKDQSGINRTEGAMVEAFVPLGLMLSRLSGAQVNEAASVDSNPAVKTLSECGDCVSGAPWPPRDPKVAPATPTDGRAIFLGFNADVKGGPIRILFLLDDTDHEGAFPIRVDALVDDAFQPIVVNDETRGLSETGMVTLQLSRSPQPTVLFGQQRRWLRLRPKAGFPGENWRPVIRSVYANAAWATAAETQSLERLGSSDGSPNQRVTVSRPPVLDATLKLRVLEPIGRDEADALRASGVDIKDGLGPRPGLWVLWREVTDPADCGPNERVYALDSETGDITFGDALHGMVPPPGRDGIVAESYQRGGGADANKVTAWSQVSLVTPLQGVEGVIVPEGGAGGSDSQNPETTVRFAPANLNLRDRALSLRDVEQLALQSSAKVAQARAIGRGATLRVVVVTRGLDPRPSSADRRAVKRYLLHRSPPSWGAPGALEVVAPRPVPIKVTVALTIDAIDFSGDVAKAAANLVRDLLDAASGGSGDGWPLGELLTDADVAARLVEIKHVEEVNSIRLQGVSDDGSLTELGPLGADQLLQLAADGVQVDLAVAQSEVGV